MNTLTVVLGVVSVAFLIAFLMWFFTHAISRDKLLVKFGKKYFVLLSLLMLSIICVLSAVIMWHSKSGTHTDSYIGMLDLEIGLRQFISIDALPNGLSAYDRIFSLVVMMIQILVFDGLIIASMVGWSERRSKQSKKGLVRYSKKELVGRLVSLYDKTSKLLAERKAGKKVDWRELCERNQYAVVIGANEMVASVVKNLLQKEDQKQGNLNYLHEQENQYVILQTNTDIDRVRQMLKAHLTEEEVERVIIYAGSRESVEELRGLYVEHASEIYILGENTEKDGGESYHDTMNMRCLSLVAKLLNEDRVKKEAEGQKYRRKVCRVLFEYQTTYQVFQFSDVSQQISQTMVFLPFNRYESWARKVIVDCVSHELSDARDVNQPIHYTPLDGYEGISYDSDKHVHLVVIGMSKMGVAMGVQAMYQAHYPNYVRDEKLKTRITFIDANAKQEMDFFKGRYDMLMQLMRHRYIDANSCDKATINSEDTWVDPMQQPGCQWQHLSEGGKNFLDIELEFVQGSVESEGVREYLRQIAQDESSKLTIAVCLPQAHQAIATSLYMPIEVYQSKQLQQIWVYQLESADIIANLEDPSVAKSSIRYEKLRAFGMLYGECMESRTRYLKALLVNGVYNLDGEEYSAIERDMGNPATYHDLISDWKWLDKEKGQMMTVALKWSNKYYVDLMYQKLRSIMPMTQEEAIGGYHNPLFARKYEGEMNLEKELDAYLEKNKACLAECEHNRWNIQQLLLGFAPANVLEDNQLKAYVQDGAVAKEKKEEFKQLKEQMKHSSAKVHPNICDFAHLDLVDPGAKGYDQKLNTAIPKILIMVDGYGV